MITHSLLRQRGARTLPEIEPLLTCIKDQDSAVTDTLAKAWEERSTMTPDHAALLQTDPLQALAVRGHMAHRARAQATAPRVPSVPALPISAPYPLYDEVRRQQRALLRERTHASSPKTHAGLIDSESLKFLYHRETRAAVIAALEEVGLVAAVHRMPRARKLVSVDGLAAVLEGLSYTDDWGERCSLLDSMKSAAMQRLPIIYAEGRRADLLVQQALLQEKADALLSKAEAAYAAEKWHDCDGLSEALGVLYARIDELALEADGWGNLVERPDYQDDVDAWFRLTTRLYNYRRDEGARLQRLNHSLRATHHWLQSDATVVGLRRGIEALETTLRDRWSMDLKAIRSAVTEPSETGV